MSEPASKVARMDNRRYESAFEQPAAYTDVKLRVENRVLHFWKILLCLASPVFQHQFELGNQESDVFPMPGKKIKEMDIFLKNMNPAHVWKPLEDDATLDILLRLGHEYKTDHILQKCQHYMKKEIKDLQQNVQRKNCPATAIDRAFRYFFYFQEFQLVEVEKLLLKLVASIPMEKHDSCSEFQRLNDQSQMAIVKARCGLLEQGTK